MWCFRACVRVTEITCLGWSRPTNPLLFGGKRQACILLSIAQVPTAKLGSQRPTDIEGDSMSQRPGGSPGRPKGQIRRVYSLFYNLKCEEVWCLRNNIWPGCNLLRLHPSSSSTWPQIYLVLVLDALRSGSGSASGSQQAALPKTGKVESYRATNRGQCQRR